MECEMECVRRMEFDMEGVRGEWNQSANEWIERLRECEVD